MALAGSYRFAVFENADMNLLNPIPKRTAFSLISEYYKYLISMCRVTIEYIEFVCHITHMQEYNDYLFHYTNSIGIIGMINEKALWATNVDFLNDENEKKLLSKGIWKRTRRLFTKGRM